MKDNDNEKRIYELISANKQEEGFKLIRSSYDQKLDTQFKIICDKLNLNIDTKLREDAIKNAMLFLRTKIKDPKFKFKEGAIIEILKNTASNSYVDLSLYPLVASSNRSKSDKGLKLLDQAYGLKIRSYLSSFSDMNVDDPNCVNLKQEALKILWTKIHEKNTFKFATGKILPYLKTIARNSFLKKEKTPVEYNSNKIYEQIDDSFEEADYEKINKTNDTKLRSQTRCFELLNKDEQKIIIMKFYDKKSSREIGDEIGKSEGWVNSTFRRSRIKLKKCMDAQHITKP